MDTIRAVIFILHLSLLGLCTSSKVPSECFRAAVLDHVQQTDPNNPLDYSRNVELNLKVYEKAASVAKRKVFSYVNYDIFKDCLNSFLREQI